MSVKLPTEKKIDKPAGFLSSHPVLMQRKANQSNQLVF
jgi:hypothetical protein